MRTNAMLAALDTLPTHPVFLTDLTAGVVAIALRFHARDTHVRGDRSADYGFPGGDNAFLMLGVVNAVAQRLGDLVDVTPLTALLEQQSLGYRRERDVHDGLDCLAQLAHHPGHVIVPDNEHDDLAIARFLAAAQLALLGTLLLSVGDRLIGCAECSHYKSGDRQRTYIGRVLGDSHRRGELAPGYHVASDLERAAGFAEYTGPFGAIREPGFCDSPSRRPISSPRSARTTWHAPPNGSRRSSAVLANSASSRSSSTTQRKPSPSLGRRDRLS